MKLLSNLYSIHSMSGQETPMRKFIKSYVKNLGGNIALRQENGNIYITKGQAEHYPCLVAHLDQVQKNHSKDFRTMNINGYLYGFSHENSRLEGLGADDKNGIWIALKCLEKFPALKIAFFKEEEIGCGGSRIADMAFFKDCQYCIQADRRNGGDLITSIGGIIMTSQEFFEDIAPIAVKYGYKDTSGIITDVGELTENGIGISCINISCGYYNPHSDSEYTNLAELENALAFVESIVTNMTKVYPHKAQVLYGYGDCYYHYPMDSEDIMYDRWSPAEYDDPYNWVYYLVSYNVCTWSDLDYLEKIWEFAKYEAEAIWGIHKTDFIHICECIMEELGIPREDVCEEEECLED